MKIAFINSWYAAPAKGSGTTVAIRGLARGLAALGHQVEVLRPPCGGRLLKRLWFNITLPGQLAGHGYDAVIGFDWDGFLYRPPPGRPYTVGLKGILADELRHERGLTRLALWLQSWLERANVRHAARVLTTSCYSRRIGMDAYHLPPDRIATVPEGIDLARWPDPVRRPPHHPLRPPVILSVARQYPRKNTQALIRAMEQVARTVPRARLHIIGDGPERGRLQALSERLGLADRITFFGPVDDTTLKNAYRQADLFCLPSRQEGFGIAFLEAMAAGLPVVAGSVAAVPELVDHGRTGMLVPPNDTEQLATALIHLLTRPELRRRMGAAGRRKAADYDWPKVAARFLNRAGLSA